MDKPTYKLVGAPCGQRGQYTFYKALRLCGADGERIVALGDFMFVRLWRDSELVCVGELQLLWTDRVAEQTLVSLRLYFLPENTPDGRGAHGQDEVLAINEKVVMRAAELAARACRGDGWSCGLPAVWRGACAAPPDLPSGADLAAGADLPGGAELPAAAAAAAGDEPEPLRSSRLDFTDVDREKAAIEDRDAPGVVVFSYPRYCRYRALLRRLDGLASAWLRDSLVAALGGYAAPTTATRILFCKDTFEYPELEGHEFVCNQLAPRLKGRPRGRRRQRRARSHSLDPPSDRDRSPSDTSVSSERDKREVSPVRAAPRGADVADGADSADGAEERATDRAFMSQLRTFHRDRSTPLKHAHSTKDLRLRSLYQSVVRSGGYEQVCRERGWRALHGELQGRPASPSQATLTRRHYERLLLPFEKHERRNGSKWWKLPKLHNGTSKEHSPRQDRKKHHDTTPITTIDITAESPVREIVERNDDKVIPRLRTPSPPRERRADTVNENGGPAVDDEKPGDPREPPDLLGNESDAKEHKPASELNQEFLDSLPKEENAEEKPPLKISVKSVEKLIERKTPPAPNYMDSQSMSKLLGTPGLTEYLQKQSLTELSASLLEMAAKQSAGTPAAILADIAAKQSLSEMNEMSSGLLAGIAAKRGAPDAGYQREAAAKGVGDASFLREMALKSLGDNALLREMAAKGFGDSGFLREMASKGFGDSGFLREMASKGFGDSGFLREMASKGFGDTSFLREMASKGFGDSGFLREMASKGFGDSGFLREMASRGAGDTSFLRELATKQSLGEINTSFLAEIAQAQQELLSSSTLGGQLSVSGYSLANGRLPGAAAHPSSDKGTVSPPSRPAGRSLLRSVRVKPTRTAVTAPPTPCATPLRPDSASRSPPVTSSAPPAAPLTNFGINYPAERPGHVSSTSTSTAGAAAAPAQRDAAHSDDEIIEVPYRPKTPEIIDLDEYESPESPQAIKKKKLDILKERGLEVTAVSGDWTSAAPAQPLASPSLPAAVLHTSPMLGLNPAMQQQIMTQAQFFQMYNQIMPQGYTDGLTPPKVIQGKSIYGSSGPEKTVYGNPKDPFMPPPHVLQGAPPLKQPRCPQAPPPAAPDILDLSSKRGAAPPKPAVEIVRVPAVPTGSYSLVDGKAVVGSNLEITLVRPKSPQPKPQRPRQKRSSTGQFMSNKTPPRDAYAKLSPSPSRRAPDIVIPSYQLSGAGRDGELSPTSSTGSRDGAAKPPVSFAQSLASLMDPVYMSAVYGSLGQLAPGLPDQHQLAMYQNLMSGRLMRNYPGLLNVGAVTSTPTTKN